MNFNREQQIPVFQVYGVMMDDSIIVMRGHLMHSVRVDHQVQGRE